MDVNEEEDEKEIFSQTWNKMANSLHKEGLREGSSAGRDETFQKGFNLGFEDGYLTGFKLGLHNGILKYLNSDSSFLESTHKERLSSVEAHTNPSKGLCVTCLEGEQSNDVNSGSSSSELEVKTLSDIRELQIKYVSDNEQSLYTEEYVTLLKDLKLDSLCS